MERATLVAVAAWAISTTAAAQSWPDVVGAYVAPLPEPVTCDDADGMDELPWDDFDPRVHYLPRGLMHWGVALRIAGMPDSGSRLAAGPFVEVGALLDVRFHRRAPLRTRFVLAASFQPRRDTFSGEGQLESSSPFGVRFRWMPISVDVHQWVTLRAGVDMGIQLVPFGGDRRQWDLLMGFESAVVARADDGRVEIGITLACQWTGVGVADRWGDHIDQRGQTVLGGSVAYLWP